jgi:hypothetical protein
VYITDQRSSLVAHGHSHKKIHVTEFGIGYPSVDSLVTIRDWVKIQVDYMVANPTIFGPFYIYNFRNSGTDLGNIHNQFGIVDYNFNPKEPYYSYAATINPASEDTEPPDPPEGLISGDTTQTTASLTWNPASDNVGVDVYRVFDSNDIQKAQTLNTNVIITGLTPGTPYEGYYVKAVDAAGNVSDPSDPFPTFTTEPPSGVQSHFTYEFSGSTVPTVFTQTGLGFTVSGGVAIHNNPVSNGKYLTVAPYHMDHQSTDHAGRITVNASSSGADRSAMVGVRVNALGTEGVFTSSNFGTSDSLQIFTVTGGVARPRKAVSIETAVAGQDVELSVSGNVYTARLIDASDAVLAEAEWTDTTEVFSGVANRRSAIGWEHLRVGGVNYSAPGIRAFKSSDVGSVQSSGEAWIYADESDWPEVMATDLWEIVI